MRILHVIQSYQMGGLEKMVVNLAEESCRRGYLAEVLAYSEDGPVRELLGEKGIPAHLLLGAGGIQPRRSLALARLLRRRGFDLIHTHHLGPYIYGAGAARLAFLPHVHTEHSHEFYDAPLRALMGKSMDSQSHVVAVSREIAQYRRRKFSSVCTVIENGVDIRASRGEVLEETTEAPIVDGPTTLAYIGRLAPEKGVDVLLRALKASKDDGVKARLLIAGDGEERPDLERLVEALDLKSDVEFLGLVNDVKALHQRVDALALASHREGLPMAILEGMASGRPFIATDVGELPRLAEQGAGVVTPAGDPLAFSRAINTLVDNRALLQQLGEQARRVVEQRYSLERMVERYLDIYERAVAGARKAVA